MKNRSVHFGIQIGVGPRAGIKVGMTCRNVHIHAQGARCRRKRARERAFLAQVYNHFASMGSVGANYRCVWCDMRAPEAYSPDGVDVPICGPCCRGFYDKGWMNRVDAKEAALKMVLVIRDDAAQACNWMIKNVVKEIAQFL